MPEINRRQFVVSATAGCVLGQRLLPAPTTPPAMAIVRSKTTPTDPQAIAEEARRLTRAAIDAVGGMQRFVSKGHKVFVKPNIAWDRRPEQAACTNPDVVATVVQMCFEAGAARVLVSDNPCNQAVRTFPRSGIQEAARKAGAEVFFLDPRKFRRMAIKGRVLKEWEVYQDMVECDCLINVPILKHHSLATMTAGLKNLLGAVGGSRDRLHQNLGDCLADLAFFLRPRLLVIDAIRVLVANGPVGGNLADVKRMDTVIASVDPVAADAFASTLLGHQPKSIEHIATAATRGLGVLEFEKLKPRRLEI